MAKQSVSVAVMVQPFNLPGVRCMGEQVGCGDVVVKLRFGAITIVLCESCRNRLAVGLGVDVAAAKILAERSMPSL